MDTALCIFTGKESLGGDNTANNIWFLKYFLLSQMHMKFVSTYKVSFVLFIPTTLVSLPPGVMFRMHDIKRSMFGGAYGDACMPNWPH